jgi:hypothetical protein
MCLNREHFMWQSHQDNNFLLLISCFANFFSSVNCLSSKNLQNSALITQTYHIAKIDFALHWGNIFILIPRASAVNFTWSKSHASKSFSTSEIYLTFRSCHGNTVGQFLAFSRCQILPTILILVYHVSKMGFTNSTIFQITSSVLSILDPKMINSC